MNLTYACGVVEMVRNHCIRSFIVSIVLVAVIIICQLFTLEDTTSDAESVLQQNEFIPVITDVGDERNRSRRKAIESFSLPVVCANCTFTNGSSVNGTNNNDTVRMIMTFDQYLRGCVHRLNHVPIIRNLDKFDLQAASDGSLVMVVQVQTCLF